MIRILLLLVTLVPFSLIAKPEKDFDLYCVWDVADAHAVFKYRGSGVPKIFSYEVRIQDHEIKGNRYKKKWSYNNIGPKYEDFGYYIGEHILKDKDDDTYYFGDSINQNKGRGYRKYEVELYRKTLGINSYDCNLIDTDTANGYIERWKDWQKTWRIKYPKPKPPENKI